MECELQFVAEVNPVPSSNTYAKHETKKKQELFWLYGGHELDILTWIYLLNLSELEAYGHKVGE